MEPVVPRRESAAAQYARPPLKRSTSTATPRRGAVAVAAAPKQLSSNLVPRVPTTARPSSAITRSSAAESQRKNVNAILSTSLDFPRAIVVLRSSSPQSSTQSLQLARCFMFVGELSSARCTLRGALLKDTNGGTTAVETELRACDLLEQVKTSLSEDRPRDALKAATIICDDIFDSCATPAFRVAALMAKAAALASCGGENVAGALASIERCCISARMVPTQVATTSCQAASRLDAALLAFPSSIQPLVAAILLLWPSLPRAGEHQLRRALRQYYAPHGKLCFSEQPFFLEPFRRHTGLMRWVLGEELKSSSPSSNDIELLPQLLGRLTSTSPRPNDDPRSKATADSLMTEQKRIREELNVLRTMRSDLGHTLRSVCEEMLENNETALRANHADSFNVDTNIAAPTTPHKILGVPGNASRAEITKAYRLAALRLHPDRLRRSTKESSSHSASVEESRRKYAEELFHRVSDAYRELIMLSA